MLKLTGIFERQERPVRLAGRDAYDVWSDTYPASAHNPLMRLEERAVAQVLSRLRAPAYFLGATLRQQATLPLQE